MSTTWTKRGSARSEDALWSSATLPWQLDLPWQFIFFVVSTWSKRTPI